ncbi:hypothetical protein [Thalassotalea sp. ND16A]|uniref:hypothetical protein n=1 Tax=Thalassotalea sp. ND16A TaxID=1535422 RepID=UPI00051A521C|nr:hypothetical protein [Thalassotalea sp. ND16A]KGJ88076.1 hypothetical protein ND16A_2629 [Thalassotalea sp. ND16A]
MQVQTMQEQAGKHYPLGSNVDGQGTNLALRIIINAHHQQNILHLPKPPGKWRQIINTADSKAEISATEIDDSLLSIVGWSRSVLTYSHLDTQGLPL